MGLEPSYLNFIESSIDKGLGAVKGCHMLELGDQVIFDNNIAEETGKDYFVKRGFEHVSVDINGLHGAVIRDLTKPEQFIDWHSSYDVLTNSGTSEHVEPFESQYECFKIIHDCIKVGGIAIHMVPDQHERDKHGAWKDHCRYYYSESFFGLLAKECEYELISNTVINGLRCATIKKVKDTPFMNDRAKFLGWVAQRSYSNHPVDIIRRLLSQMGIGKFLRWMSLK
jgi:hypothetical protein